MTITLPNSFTDWAAAGHGDQQRARAGRHQCQPGRAAVRAVLADDQAGTFNAAIGGFGGTGIPYNDYNLALNSAYAARCTRPR